MDIAPSRLRHRLLPVTVRQVMILLLWGFSGLGLAAAINPGAAFDEANKLYEQGRYGAAADAYEQIWKGGQTTASVLFNLGNARWKAGDHGRAIIAYLQAQRLAPRDADIRQNLEFARRSLKGANPEESGHPLWRRWLTRLSPNEWTAVAGTFGVLLFSCFALREWNPLLREKLGTPLRLTGLGFALSLVASATVISLESQTVAVVVVKESTIRFTPLDESPASFNAPDGTELVVLEGKPDANGLSQWFRVTDAAQRVGWVKRDQIAFVRES